VHFSFDLVFFFCFISGYRLQIGDGVDNALIKGEIEQPRRFGSCLGDE
jgi:hypothetical protein